MSDSAWHADIELNLTSMFYCVRAAVRAMREAGGGSVICTSSGAALGAVSGTAPYGTAKAAILQLVRYAAVEYGPSGVRVNAVIPGAVKTAAFMGYIGTEERLARYEGQIPLRRACRPEDIANAVLWLASDDSACVTGIGLVVDGGASAKRAEPTSTRDRSPKPVAQDLPPMVSRPSAGPGPSCRGTGWTCARAARRRRSGRTPRTCRPTRRWRGR